MRGADRERAPAASSSPTNCRARVRHHLALDYAERRLRARTDLEHTVGNDLAAAAAALAATLEFAALEARCDAALGGQGRSPRRVGGGARVAAGPSRLLGGRGAPSRGGVLTRGPADLLRAARLGEFEATFAAKKVGVTTS